MPAFLALLLAYVLSQFYRAFLAVVAADLSRDLGLSASDLGLVSSAWFAAFAVGQIPVGLALDRFGPRRTVAGGMLFAVAGAALLAFASGFGGAAAALAVIGLGCAPVLMGAMYLIGRTQPPERFATLSALMIGLGNLGNLAGATPLALASAAFGWRWTMLAIAALTALAALLVALTVRDPPPAEGGPEGAGLAGYRDLLAIPALWLLLPVVATGYAVVIAARSLWIAPYLGELHGFDAIARSNAAFVMAAAIAAGALAYGPLERWVGDPKRTALAGSALTAAGFVAIGLAGHAGGGLAVALFALVGAAGLTYGTLMTHGRRFLPARLLGRGMTLLNIGFIGGAGLLQAASAAFVRHADAAGLPAATTYGRLYLAFGLGLALATAVYARAPRGPGHLSER